MNAARPLTIFVDAHSLDKGFHGTHSFLRELYGALLGEYGGLDIYFGTYDPDKIREIFPGVDDAHILPYRRRWPSFVRFLYDIPRYIHRYKFDYAHFQYVGVPWRTATRSIVTLHDVLYEDYPDDFPRFYRVARKVLFADSLQRADIKTTVSAYSRGRIANHYQVPEEQIHIIPNAVDNPLWENFPSREAAKTRIRQTFGVEDFILYVSRVEPRKNHLLLLDTYFALHLHQQGIPLVLIGTESLKVPGLKERLEALTPAESRWVYWFDQVGPKDLVAFYRSCRLFIYPSRAEGFGIPPLEAALCGAPVLCSRGTAMEGYHFFDPYTFDPSCGSELSDKLQDMILRPPGADFLHQVAQQVKHLYSRAESARVFYSIIQTNSMA
jgi:glycosyltransferase involved in cell wall biosynthesis